MPGIPQGKDTRPAGRGGVIHACLAGLNRPAVVQTGLAGSRRQSRAPPHPPGEDITSRIACRFDTKDAEPPRPAKSMGGTCGCGVHARGFQCRPGPSGQPRRSAAPFNSGKCRTLWLRGKVNPAVITAKGYSGRSPELAYSHAADRANRQTELLFCNAAGVSSGSRRVCEKAWSYSRPTMPSL